MRWNLDIELGERWKSRVESMGHTRLWRYDILLEHHNAFEQFCHAGNCFAVANVCLDTIHRQWPVRMANMLEGAAHSAHLCWIANLSACSVYLYKGDIIGRNLRVTQDFSKESLLSIHVRGDNRYRASAIIPSRGSHYY